MAILRVMIQAGLRVSELVRLRIADLDLGEKELKINGKGEKQRLVPLTKNTVTALKEHLVLRRLDSFANYQELFLNDKKCPFQIPQLNEWFKQLCAAAGVQKPGLTVRNLRHTCLTLLLHEGAELPALKKLAGHKSLRTTQRYLRVTQNQLREAIKKHPLG